MRWNTPRGRLLLILGALLIGAAITTLWRARQAAQRRARQAAQRRAQQQHELDLMKNGAIEFMKGVGSPSKAMEQTGDPFTPRPAPKSAKPAEEKPR
jgi:hypothetical protein